MLEKIPEAEGWEWSALLTEMMQTPTIKGIAEKIEAFQKDTDYVIDPCLVQLKKSVKGKLTISMQRFCFMQAQEH